MARFDPSRPDFMPYGLRCVRWTPMVMKRYDRHNEIELIYLERGSLTQLLAGRKVVVQARQLNLFWAATPHQTTHFEGLDDFFVATIPLDWFLQCKFPDLFVQALLHGQLVCEPNPQEARFDQELFQRWLDDLRTDRPELKKIVLLEMEARLRRLAYSVLKDAPSLRKKTSRQVSLRGGDLSKVEQMAAYIAQHYTESLAVEDISRSVGLHPNYAMSLFKTTFGTTLITYLTELRLSHAQRLLTMTDDTVLDIALDSGFNSISRFNTAFKANCGCSPRQYRHTNQIKT